MAGGVASIAGARGEVDDCMAPEARRPTNEAMDDDFFICFCCVSSFTVSLTCACTRPTAGAGS